MLYNLAIVTPEPILPSPIDRQAIRRFTNLAAARDGESEDRTCNQQRITALLLLLYLLACFSKPVYADESIRILKPRARETIHGIYALQVSRGLKASKLSIEFSLGSRRLGISDGPPLLWDTAFAADGKYTLVATARDRRHNVVNSCSQEFVVSNFGNTMSVLGIDPARPISKTATLDIKVHDAVYFPALIIAYVDGEQVATREFEPRTHDLSSEIAFDTTKYSNGTHELYISVDSQSRSPDASSAVEWHNWRAAFERVVDFENGHSPMEIVSNFQHVYLKRGEESRLSCHQLFTDGALKDCDAPLYTSDQPLAVNVSEDGVLRARLDQGFANVTVAASGKSTEVYVWLLRSTSLPHFSGNGTILHRYSPGRSLFVVAPFSLAVDDLTTNERLRRLIRSSGINTLSQGFYPNPRNLNANYTTWRRHYDSTYGRKWRRAKEFGFHIVATGDDICRRIGADAWWTLNWRYGQRAVRHAFESLARAGNAIALEMVDEVSMLWGPTPLPPVHIGQAGGMKTISCLGGGCVVDWPDNPITPNRTPSGVYFALEGSSERGLNTPNGKLYAAYVITANSFQFFANQPITGIFTFATDPKLELLWWAGNFSGCPTEPCSPPVPNDALLRISHWLHTSRPRIPISWPPLGRSPNSVEANWQGTSSLSDYTSHYWYSSALRHTYSWSMGIHELNASLLSSFYQRQSFLKLDRPQLFLTDMTSFVYTKRTTNGIYYQPQTDLLVRPGMSGNDVVSTMMTAAALGAAGERPYFFENARAATTRRDASLGTVLQTGGSPDSTNPSVHEAWEGIKFAALALTRLFPKYLLGEVCNSPAFGRNLVTAVRHSADGRLLMIVNDNDWQRVVSVNLARYRYNPFVLKYSVSSDGITRCLIRNETTDIAKMAPGEAIVFIFPRDPLVGKLATPQKLGTGSNNVTPGS